MDLTVLRTAELLHRRFALLGKRFIPGAGEATSHGVEWQRRLKGKESSWCAAAGALVAPHRQ
jgi:hypothetical protein